MTIGTVSHSQESKVKDIQAVKNTIVWSAGLVENRLEASLCRAKGQLAVYMSHACELCHFV